MEKIVLGSGKELEIITCGILADKEKVTIKFLPGEDSLSGLNEIFLSADETKIMTLLSENREPLAVYNGYTGLQSISQEMEAAIGYTHDEGQAQITGKLVTVVLCKPDRTERRLASVEDQVTDMQLALCEIYEGTV
ncbi:MAG: hypothetical protein Q4C61_16235 [Lachnospiraceae bacterium]|nr:hypothetical protein [Lachnospiraceae bacterium]